MIALLIIIIVLLIIIIVLQQYRNSTIAYNQFYITDQINKIKKKLDK